jgi:hypothetical protein
MTNNRADVPFDPHEHDDSGADDPDDLAESLAGEMAAARARLAQVPAATVVANHAMGLYELAAIHLSQEPPNFGEATIAIDAMAALIDRLPGRLGDDEATLRESLSQLRMAFVVLRDRAAGADSGSGVGSGAAES